MSNLSRAALALLIIFGSACVLAAQEPPSNKEHLAGISWIVGDWTAKVQPEHDFPGQVSQGDPLRLDMTCARRLGDNVIAGEVVFTRVK